MERKRPSMLLMSRRPSARCRGHLSRGNASLLLMSPDLVQFSGIKEHTENCCFSSMPLCNNRFCRSGKDDVRGALHFIVKRTAFKKS